MTIYDENWKAPDDMALSVHVGVKVSQIENRALIALQGKYQLTEQRRVSTSEIVRKALRMLLDAEGIML